MSKTRNSLFISVFIYRIVRTIFSDFIENEENKKQGKEGTYYPNYWRITDFFKQQVEHKTQRQNINTCPKGAFAHWFWDCLTICLCFLVFSQIIVSSYQEAPFLFAKLNTTQKASESKYNDQKINQPIQVFSLLSYRSRTIVRFRVSTPLTQLNVEPS